MSLVAIKDKKNNDWILQNKETGDIVRFSFEEKSNPTTKSEFPTLVDMKITDHCDFGCSMCYQSSTKEGKHANLFPEYKDQGSVISISDIAESLKSAKVLEVVLGGGEPTIHPRIVDILKTLKGSGFIVGITTKNYGLVNSKYFKQIIENVDTIAISCNSVYEVEQAKALYDDIFGLHIINKVKLPAVYIQNILGLTSMETLKNFLDACIKQEFKNVTLLGYKSFGFGTQIKEKEFGEEWIDMIKESGLNIGIDSIVVDRWREQLINKGVRKEFLVSGEGKFSMYVDMVEQTMAASSFTLKTDLLKKIDRWGSEKLTQQILENFRRY